MRPSDARWFWILALPALGVVVFGIPSLWYPFGFDQSNQAFIAWRVLEGEVLYTDIFSLKPPLITLLHSTALTVFGHRMLAIRIADMLWMLANTCLLAALCVRLVGRDRLGIAALAAAFYAHFYYSLCYWYTAQADGWTNLLSTLAIWLATTRWTAAGRHRFALPLLAGTSAALAFWFKYTVAGVLGVVALVFLLATERSWKARWSDVAFCGLGALSLCGLIVAGLWASGAWSGFVDHHVPALVRYAGTGAGEGSVDVSFLSGILRKLTALDHAPRLLTGAPMSFTLGGVAVLLLPWLAWRVRSDRSALAGTAVLAAWAVSAWLSTASQGRFFVYHFLPLFPVAAICCALLVGEAFAGIRAVARSPGQLAAGAVAIAGLLGWATTGATSSGFRPPITAYRHLAQLSSSQTTIQEDWASSYYEFTESFNLRGNLETVRFLSANSGPDDRLLVWGTSSALYFLARLPPPGRIYASVQVMDGFGGKVDPGAWVAELRSAPPAFIVVQSGDEIPHILGHSTDSAQQLARFPLLRRFLRAQYAKVADFPTFAVWERKGHGRAAALKSP